MNATPGPWTTRCDRRSPIWDVFSNGWMIAQVWATSPAGDLPSEANARLIAAAPDLLAALQSMLQETESRGYRAGDTIFLARAQAVAAIAKAEAQ